MMPSTAISTIARKRASLSRSNESISLYSLSLEGISVGAGPPFRDTSLRTGVPVPPSLLREMPVWCSTLGAEHSPSVVVARPILGERNSQVSELCVAESQRIGDDGNGTQTHCRARDDGAEQQTEEWIEQARSDGYTERVIDESEEKVLTNIPHHRTAQDHGFRDAAKVAFDEGNAGTFNCDIGAGAHCDANVSGGERGRVVDAVAGHRYDVALLTEFLHALMFALRFDASFHLVEAKSPGHGVGGALVVAGQHENLESQLVNLRNGFRRGRLDGIGYSQDARELAVDAD